jgi:CSLREA domain-containing protein
MLTPASAQAVPKTYVANKTGDHAPNGCSHGDCTLREAVLAANAHTGRDTIELRAATYTLGIPSTDEDAAADGDLDITEGIKVLGKGPANTIINGGGAGVGDWAFELFVGRSNISSLTVRDSVMPIQEGEAGIFVRDPAGLRMSHARVLHNIATHTNACCSGITAQQTAPVSLDHVLVANNTAIQGCCNGLELGGRVSLKHVTSRGNSAGATSCCNGLDLGPKPVTLSHVRILDNDGGGCCNGMESYAGPVTANRLVVRGNDGGGDFNGYLANGQGRVAISSAAFSNNDGGGCCNGVTLDDGDAVMRRVVISGHDGECCNGFLGGSGRARLTDLVISDNDGSQCCQGLENGSGAEVIKRVTVSGNDAGFNCAGVCLGGGNVRLINVTVSRNSATVNGGGIYGTNSLFMNNVTVTKNRADSDNTGGGDGGGIYATSGSPTIQNSIIAGNSVGSTGAGPDCFGTIVSHGHNLIGDDDGCTIVGNTGSNLLNVPAGLEPLRDNGGFTKTHALRRRSKAINHGSPKRPGSGGNACDKHDQRQATRPQDKRCDIGAYERRHRHRH